MSRYGRPPMACHFCGAPRERIGTYRLNYLHLSARLPNGQRFRKRVPCCDRCRRDRAIIVRPRKYLPGNAVGCVL